MSISSIQARTSIANLHKESFSLVPSSLLYLFEIDVSDLLFSQSTTLDNNIQIFRFHNHIKLLDTSIYFGIDEFGLTKEYIAAPIAVEGFEYTSKGALPTPRLSITVTDESVPLLAILKDAINKLGDLVGAKVTRIRTFAKFIDKKNFENSQAPRDFSPDPNSYSKDVFFIDRKSSENKMFLEFELASILDVEGVKLPARLVLANRCPFSYRGEGCMYEYKENRVDAIHGTSANSTLPQSARVVANDKDELITDILGVQTKITYIGKWDKDTYYNAGNSVYIEKDGLKYHYCAKLPNQGISPPSTSVWIADSCGKSVNSCKLRYGLKGSAGGVTLGLLNYGGFSACNKVQ